jgi:POT family proton-dependent oligopeptide transporter
MGINIGAFLAPVVAEVVKREFGFGPAFAVASGGMVISVGILWSCKRHVEAAKSRPKPVWKDPESTAITEDVPPPAPTHASPIDAVPDRVRIGALIVVFAIVIVFWMVFHQNGSTLTYWADDNTDWNVSGIIANAINPFWVVTLTFPLVWLWKRLDERGLEPSTPLKMAIGMLLSAVCFTILYFAARTGEATEYRPDLASTADFRITEWSLNQLKVAGVPESTLTAMERKDADGKYLIKDKKFAGDDNGSGEQKLAAKLNEVIGPGPTTEYKPLILKYSYIYRVSPLWLIIAYAVMTLGELLLSPMGLSLVSKVAPLHLRGLMMGGWFVAAAVGNKLTMIGVFWDRWLHSSFFALLGLMGLVTGLVLLCLIKPLRKAMPGV